jgi:hypothetical protein
MQGGMKPRDWGCMGQLSCLLGRPAIATRVLTESPRGINRCRTAGGVKTRTGLCRHSNRSLFASGNSAGKRFGKARDSAGIFGDIGQFCVTETALSRVSGGKATESQRLFRTRQETGIAKNCVVVEAVRKHPVRTAGGGGQAASLAALSFQFQGIS